MKAQFITSLAELIKPHSIMKIVVGVSGGLDSMCLAACLNKLKQDAEYDTRFEFAAVTIDHTLRDESSDEAAEVGLYLKDMGIKSSVIKWCHGQDPKMIKNMHQKARDARYRLLIECCLEEGADCLFTAHNKDDQAETIIMRIMRGTGIDGIAGMPAMCVRNGIKIIRPFLKFSRKQIESAYEELGLRYFVNDPSNENTKYTRASIRQQLKGHFDNSKYLELINRLELLGENAKRARECLEESTSQAFGQACQFHNLGFISLNIKKFQLFHQEIRLRLLVRIFSKISKPKHPPRLDSLKLLESQICTPDYNWKDRTLIGCQIVKHLDTIVFFREKQAIKQGEIPLNIGNNVWDNRFNIYVSRKLGEPYIGHLYAKSISLSTLNSEHIMLEVLEPRLYYKAILCSTPGVFYDGKLVQHTHIKNNSLNDAEKFVMQNISIRNV